ncbi:MAG: HAMP domain-containing sensor histidine kinase [Marmoricola sp.]
MVPFPQDAPTLGAAEVDPERQAAAAAVVAEAVAVALEAAAAEAAEAVLVTAAAVTQAAGRAAAVAESARRARSFAADTAAQSVAHEAARTAARVRVHADRAAAQVQQAASLAADELARSIAAGTVLDTGRMAELLAATVRAAADAAAQDTTRAADAVARAAIAAASHVTQTVAAAEEDAEIEVTATADAQRELATATAEAVALETDARAVGVAIAARKAAAALVTHEQDARAVDRDVDDKGTEERLAAADERDSKAEDRDRLADQRELAASLRAFLGDQKSEDDEEHTAGLRVRRAAAMDRFDSRTDRVAAASDRAELSDGLARRSRAREVSQASYMFEAAAVLSHDLRVPLSSIIASLEMLEDELRGHSLRTAAELMGRAMRAGDRMVRMLDQFMRSHAPGRPTGMPEVDLEEIVQQVVLASADLLDPVGAVVETGELPVLRADPDQMYSLMQNLVSNSVKFARPGVPAVVRIGARRSEHGWRISVRDNGMGFGDNAGLDVFSLFSRGTSAVTGHGIGLATVARIVASHGGRVGAAALEDGAEIWFELPEDRAVL